MTDNNTTSNGDGSQTINLRDALEERYLAYALSTIIDRALPDVRDGLKPVHRRVLYAMHMLKLNPDQGYKKCARVVGDVIGKYHPHGDQSVYDAMVRLAQDFAQRYPLVDGQGNFGNIDGDNAAAMRYTEARMTAIAQALLDGISEDAVDFRESFTNEDEEPIVLPGNFPNLLANGTAGIAVGMATNIPPHNTGELCDAAIHLIKNPNATTTDLVEFVPGPDLPTGGILVEGRDSIIQSYETGRGGFRVRAKWHKEKDGRSYRIVVTEIPYQVQKSKLVEKIADLMLAKKLPFLGDVLDESAEDIRLVLEPKNKAVDPMVLMESLFKLTELETRVSLNMNVLSHGRIPNVLGIKDVLQQWLDHRKVVLVRRSNFRLGKIERRLEILEGYLIAFLNIDEVIRIIRFEDKPKQELIRVFKLTDNQVEAILSMQLRRLNKLEEVEIRTEHDGLSKERDGLLDLLKSDAKQWTKISGQIAETRKLFGQDTVLGKRRTQFEEAPTIDIDLSTAMVEKEPVTIVLSQKGWIRALKGHVADGKAISFKNDDKLHTAINAQTTDKIIIFASNGKFYTIGADGLPGGRGQGEPLRLMIDMDENAEVVRMFVHNPERKLMLASLLGNSFVVNENTILANTKKGKQVLNVKMPDEAICCIVVGDGDKVAAIGENKKMLVFPLSQLSEMTRGKGVRLQKYGKLGSPNLADITVFSSAEGLKWADASGRVRVFKEWADWEGNRAQAGKNPPKGFPKTGRFNQSGF